MSIITELVDLIEMIGGDVEIPSVRYLFLPSMIERPGKDAEFGVVGLADGSAGFFYVWLDDALDRLHQKRRRGEFAQQSALALVHRLRGGDAGDRAIGFGALNAISQYLFRCRGYVPSGTADSFAELAPSASDRIGMVGLFPGLVESLRKQGIPLVVVERKPETCTVAENYEVTLNPARLRGCNKVLCTAATLLNDSLDEILSFCDGAEYTAIVGPTAGCVPDPLFRRGVDVVGGSHVVDIDALIARLERGEKWGDAVRKYAMRADAYPGTAHLLADS